MAHFRITFWDVIVGLPAGVLIFMGTVLFSTLLSLKVELPQVVPLVLLVIVTLLTGTLAGITRLRQGLATALAAGIVAAGILGYLWLSSRPGHAFNTLVIGPVGMLAAIIFSPAGGWLGMKLRKVL